MKVVAVSQRVEHYPDRNETRDALDWRMIYFLQHSGYIPVPVPNALCTELPDGTFDFHLMNDWLATLKPSALVLSGGNDINQSSERDATERQLLKYASQFRLPVLGICRGMQLMANWAGAQLRRVSGHVKTRHCLSGAIAGEVNSFHCFSIANCPDGFKILAQSEDGEIEAICHESLPWEGWMWHPEREENITSRDLKRIRALFG